MQPWHRPVILTFLGLFFLSLLFYIYNPSIPVPYIHSITRLDFPQNLTTHFGRDQAFGFALREDGKTMDIGWLRWRRRKDSRLVGVTGEVVDTTIIQFYSVPLEPLLNATFPSTYPYPSASASHLFSQRLNGTLSQISFARLQKPHPPLGLVYWNLDGETISYNLQISRISTTNHTHTPPHPSTPCHSRFISSLDTQDPFFWNCMSSYPYNQEEVILAGNLGVSKLSITWKGNLIYTRGNDRALFRIRKKDGGGVVGPDSAKWLVGKVLALYELYSEVEGQRSVFVATCLDDDRHVTVAMYIFTQTKEGGEWEVDEIFPKTTYTTHIDIHSDFGSSSELDKGILYWTTYPVVAISHNTRHATFLFLSRIMSLDYVGVETSGKKHGYLFRKERVTEVGSEMMRVTGANLDANGRWVVFLTETRDVLVFRRGYASGVGREGGKEQEHPKEGVGLDTSFWSFAPDVLTNLDAGVLATGSANNHGAKVQDGGWELIRVFGRDVLRDVAGEDIVAFNLVKTLDLAPSIRPKSYNESSAAEKEDHYVVFTLYENTPTKSFKMVALDLSRTYEGTWVWNFVQNKWEMVVGVLAVVVVFCFNEVRMMNPNARPVPPQLYPLIVSSVFFVIIFAALLRD